MKIKENKIETKKWQYFIAEINMLYRYNGITLEFIFIDDNGSTIGQWQDSITYQEEKYNPNDDPKQFAPITSDEAFLYML